MIRNVTGMLDWGYSIVLIIIIFLIGYSLKRKHKADPIFQKYFISALSFKLFGALAFGIYHLYVYQGGDTFFYFITGKDISRLLISDPIKYFTLIFGDFNYLSDKIFSSLNFTSSDSIMWSSPSNYFVVRFAAAFAPLSLNGYFAMTILFSVFSFILIWKCFRNFCELFPDSTNLIAIAFLFFPTVIFWGSGVGKDSLMLGALAGFTAVAFNIFIFNRSYLKSLILLFILGYWLYICKAYILLAYFGPLAFAVFFHRVSRIENNIFKFFLRVFSFGIMGVIGFFAIQLFIEEFIAETAYLAVSVTAMQDAGSKYDLGVDLTNFTGIGSVLQYFPIAVITAWFRPFPWEARNIAMALSALESLFVTFFFIRILFKGWIYKTVRFIRNSPIIFANLAYATIFCALVTLSTGNFGTLVRYKLPAMPYLIVSLLIINKNQVRKKINEF